MANLLALGHGRVIVEFPNESVTGADMEWNFVNEDDGTFFRILLQAKRLYEKNAHWAYYSYKHLLHLAGNSGKLQAELLCETARTASFPTYPLYIFYNHANAYTLCRAEGVRNVQGVNLSDGFLMEAAIKLKTSKQWQREVKTLGALCPFMFFLSDIFCPETAVPLGPMAFSPKKFSMPLVMSFGGGPPTLGRPIPPRPRDVRQRLADTRQRLISAHEELPELKEVLPPIPEVGNSIPESIQSLMNRIRAQPDSKSEEPLRFWRATFISYNPPEE